MVVYFHEPECPTEILVCYLPDQGHSEGLYNLSMTFSTIYYIFKSSDLFATKFGLMVNHHKQEYPVKNWIAVFKVKVTAKDKNVNKLLFR